MQKLYLYQRWNWGASIWVNNNKETYNYDSDGNSTFMLSEKWDGTEWIMHNKQFSFYDSFGRHFYYFDSKIDCYYSTITDVENRQVNIMDYYLSQNYPNPFNPSTVIKYGVPEKSNIKIEIFNMLGQSIKILVNTEKLAGYYETTWNARNLPSGVYLIKIEANGVNSSKVFLQVKKAILLK